MSLPLAATGAALCTELAVIGRPARDLAQRVGAVIVDCGKELFDPYRPELHYMRGPGPKWRMKHGVTARIPSRVELNSR
jgi:hypothetical protein